MSDENKQSFLEGIGSNILNTATGGALGIIMQKQADKRQLRQQQKLTNMQLAANMEMGKFNYAQQMQMWHDTNYGAQMKELAKAGLNPGLIYGTGGPGGTTAAAPANGVTGGNAPTGGGEIMGMMNQRMNLAMMQAQIENIKADTENKRVTTPNIQASTANIQANTGNTNADTALKQIELSIQKINEWYKEATVYTDVAIREAEYQKILNETAIIRNNNEITAETKKAKITEIVQASINSILTGEILKVQKLKGLSEIQVNNAEIQKMTADIMQRGQEINIKTFEANLKALYPSLGDLGGQMLNSIKSKLEQLLGLTKDYIQPNTIK